MILNKKHLSTLFLIFCFFYVFSQDQEKMKTDSTNSEYLQEVIITATRTVRQLSSLPLPAQIISKKNI